HDGARAQIDEAPLMPYPHAADPIIALQERNSRGVVEHADLLAVGAGGQRLDQFLAAAPDMASKPAPELEFAVNAKSLAAKAQLEAHALLAHPPGRVEASRNQDFAEVGVTAIFGEPPDIVEILLSGVGADIDILQFVVVDVRYQLREVVKAVIDDAEGAAGKGGIAPARGLRRDLQLQHRGAVFRR